MPDLAMCQDTECPDRMKCKRFTANPAAKHSSTASLREPWQTRCMLFIHAPENVTIKSLEVTR